MLPKWIIKKYLPRIVGLFFLLLLIPLSLRLVSQRQTPTKQAVYEIVPTPPPSGCEFGSQNECSQACGGTCNLQGSCYVCPGIVPPPATPTLPPPSCTYATQNICNMACWTNCSYSNSCWNCPPFLPTQRPSPPLTTCLHASQNICNSACWTGCSYSGGCWKCPLSIPTQRPTPFPSLIPPRPNCLGETQVCSRSSTPCCPSLTCNGICVRSTAQPTPLPTTVASRLYRCIGNNLVYGGQVVDTCEFGCNATAGSCAPPPSGTYCAQNEAGQKKCSSDGFYTQSCSGNRWINQQFCENGCSGGTCKTIACTSGELKCVGDYYQGICKADQTGWERNYCQYGCNGSGNTCYASAEIAYQAQTGQIPGLPSLLPIASAEQQAATNAYWDNFAQTYLEPTKYVNPYYWGNQIDQAAAQKIGFYPLQTAAAIATVLPAAQAGLGYLNSLGEVNMPQYYDSSAYNTYQIRQADAANPANYVSGYSIFDPREVDTFSPILLSNLQSIQKLRGSPYNKALQAIQQASEASAADPHETIVLGNKWKQFNSIDPDSPNVSRVTKEFQSLLETRRQTGNTDTSRVELAARAVANNVSYTTRVHDRETIEAVADRSILDKILNRAGTIEMGKLQASAGGGVCLDMSCETAYISSYYGGKETYVLVGAVPRGRHAFNSFQVGNEWYAVDVANGVLDRMPLSEYVKTANFQAQYAERWQANPSYRSLPRY